MPSNEVITSGSGSSGGEGGTIGNTNPEEGPDTTQVRCIERDFPGAYMGVSRLLKRQTVYGPVAWMGSLVQDAQDASGLMYRRNRYYDPQTGKFTQEDPAGLAGGINAYGFAGGDPVTYSDPYGLKVEFKDEEARRLWSQLVQSAREAARSSDKLVATSGRTMNRMLRNIWDSEATLSIGVSDRYAFFNWQDGGAYTKQQIRYVGPHATPSFGARIRMDPVYPRQRFGIPNILVLAHEIGHAWGIMMNRADAETTSVVAENSTRIFLGCHQMRTSEFTAPPPCR
jgi:RHS repeat-associated protein